MKGGIDILDAQRAPINARTASVTFKDANTLLVVTPSLTLDLSRSPSQIPTAK